jgi:hypothetical protein
MIREFSQRVAVRRCAFDAGKEVFHRMAMPIKTPAKVAGPA